ncbi:MAG: hypothetical protein J1F11_08465 [Oscillospiraceae bacterium]|nr:hypothetical protein [Oscillospiraceae bacterium]
MPDEMPSGGIIETDLIHLRLYEAQASLTSEKLHEANVEGTAVGVKYLILLFAFFSVWFKQYILFCILLIAAFASYPITYKIAHNVLMKKIKKITAIESGGYTETFFDEMHKLPGAKKDNIALYLAKAYNFCGDTKNVVKELKKVNTSAYGEDPAGAHNYYAARLMAYLIYGDLDHAADTFTKGFYYMNAYKDSPIDGTFVSLTLGMYENFCGHYDESLRLLENAMRIHSANMKPESRLPDENMTRMISYWKAVNFFAMGDKSSAWEMINSCKGFYKTPYYEQLSGQLLDDMAKQ